MAAPTFVDRTVVTKIDGTSNTTMTINKPASATAGRVGIFMLHSNSTLNPNSLTLDANVTAIASNYNVNGNFALHSSYSYYVFDGSDPSSFTFTIGGDTRDDDLVIEIWDGVNTASPIGAVGTFNTNLVAAPVVNGVTTTANESVVLFPVATKNGTALTAANANYPSGTTGTGSDKTRNNSSGVNSGSCYQEYPTSGTATGNKTYTGYLTGNQYGSSVAFELKAGSATLVISGDITIGTAKAFTTTGLSSVTGVTISTVGGGSVAATVEWAAGTGALVAPLWTDNTSYPYIGTVTVTVTDGSLTPSQSAPLVLPSGYDDETFASVYDSDDSYLGYYFDQAGTPLLDGDRVYYPTDNGFIIYADSSYEIDRLQNVDIVIHRAADKKVYLYTLVLGNEDTGITSPGITLLKISTRGISS
jgi:hypothetical protein